MSYKFSFDKRSQLNVLKPIFLTQNYIDQHQAIYISVYESNKIISELAIIIKSKFGFKKAQLVYQPYPIVNQIMMDELLIFLKQSNKIDFLLPTPNYIPFDFAPKQSIYCNFGSYQIDLTKDETALFNQMHKKVRQTIRKAQRENLEVLSNEKSLVDGYEVIKATLLKSGLNPPNYQELEKMISYNLIKCWSIYFEDKVQATLIMLFGKYDCYTYYTGTIEKAFVGAINLLYWSVMLEMKNQKKLFFDFSGARVIPKIDSKQEGIQKFKERLGSIMLQGYMWKAIFKPIKYKLYILLMKVYVFKNKSKYQKDIIDQELEDEKNN
jgi:hypothetical protein